MVKVRLLKISRLQVQNAYFVEFSLQIDRHAQKIFLRQGQDQRRLRFILKRENLVYKLVGPNPSIIKIRIRIRGDSDRSSKFYFAVFSNPFGAFSTMTSFHFRIFQKLPFVQFNSIFEETLEIIPGCCRDSTFHLSLKILDFSPSPGSFKFGLSRQDQG